METWRSGDIKGILTEVPGIGPAAQKKLAELDEPITNTWMLFGKYLSMKGPDIFHDGEVQTVSPAEHQDRFWQFLKAAGIQAHRSAIVKAVGEKINQSFPGVYDPSIYEDDDEEEE